MALAREVTGESSLDLQLLGQILTPPISFPFLWIKNGHKSLAALFFKKGRRFPSPCWFGGH